MCGIFGFSGNLNSPKDELKLLKKLLLLSESRGKEACGLAIDNTFEIKYLKEPIPASECVKAPNFDIQISKALGNNFKTVIGHSRLVTNGYEQDNNNNQPVIKNGIITIHNGIIVNNKEIWSAIGEETKISELK